jgi:hypothetical protein
MARDGPADAELLDGEWRDELDMRLIRCADAAGKQSFFCRTQEGW